MNPANKLAVLAALWREIAALRLAAAIRAAGKVQA